MAVDRATASLIVSGKTPSNSAAFVSGALRIEPTRILEFGEPHPSRSLAAQGKFVEQSKWIFREARTSASDDDPHGLASLDRLVERFEPLAGVLGKLSADYFIVVSMLGLSDSPQGGLVIGGETMRRLGLLSASFMQDIWLGSDSAGRDD